jgi:GTPase SAR1 family protein
MGNTQSEPVRLVLALNASRWREFAGDLEAMFQRLRKAGGWSNKLLTSQITEDLALLQTAVSNFEESSMRPEVTLATTGTTSSGKSTLANMMIGDLLLPKAVQEMSAGVVIVEHDDNVRQLEITKTKNAKWETGVWKDVSAEDVRQRLEATMATYRKIVTDDPIAKIEPPRFDIKWPTDIGRRPGDFGLPAGARFRIVDLPGLKFIDDELNGAVMREYTQKSLCLVAYNSFETDSRKQNALLRQVVDQVKKLSGSPARMLFVLNRIDAYRTETDPLAKEREFTEHVTRQIRSGIREALPEFAAAADAIEPIPLSSEPALYAVLAQRAADAEANEVLRKLTKDYASLYPDNQMDELPRAPSAWTDSQRRWFLSETRHQSKLDLFEKRLHSHIASNLPEILVPPLVSAAYQPARRVLEVLDALVQASRIEEQAQLEAKSQELEAIHAGLKDIQGEAISLLNPLMEVVSGDGDLLEALDAAVPAVEEALGLAKSHGHDCLGALRGAMLDLVEEPLRRLIDFADRLMRGEEPDDEIIDALDSADVLRGDIEALRLSAYGRGYWKNGGEIEGEDATQVSALIAAFGRTLSKSANALVAREARVQAERLRAALELCAQAVIACAEKRANALLKKAELHGLKGVFRGEVEFEAPKLPRLKFSPNVREWSRTIPVSIEKTVVVEKRVWYKLFLGTDYVTETRTVVSDITKSGIEVARFSDLLEGFVETARLDELVTSVADWLRDGLGTFEASLDARLKHGIGLYRNVFKDQLRELKLGAATKIENIDAFGGGIADFSGRLETSLEWRVN